jgi:RNA polymerase sigma-70 factor (ECF subfamily)
MPAQHDSTDRTLEQFRAYLECLSCIHIDPRLRRRFDWSDIIQKTLLEAYQALERIRGLDEKGQRRWLRKMLVNNLLDRIEQEKAGARDFRLEVPMQQALDDSSSRLKGWLVAEDATPEEALIKKEQGLRLLAALAQLPPRQRDALVLQRFHGWKLAEIAEHLQCTVAAVAGLHAHGLKNLRRLLPEME